MAAALCVAQADAGGSSGGAGAAHGLTVVCANHFVADVQLVLAKVLIGGNVLEVKAGAEAAVGPVKVLGNIVEVKLFVKNKDGKLLTLTVVAKIELSVVARLVNGIYHLALEVAENKTEKVLELLAGEGGNKIVVAKLSLLELIKLGLFIRL